MTELEKLEAGMEYSFWDKDVNARKIKAMKLCKKLNDNYSTKEEKNEKILRLLFNKAGSSPWVGPNFQCDYGKNIYVGDNFTANFNVVILDIKQVYIGDNCMIGPNTLITTVNHPLSPKKRREHMAIAKSITIGNDVWIGGNCTILPGVTIGNNVVIGAGSVVTKDIPSNSLAVGVPCKVIKQIKDDIKNENI